jgi:glycosyltransferase involved in cell wall biosynthesis
VIEVILLWWAIAALLFNLVFVAALLSGAGKIPRLIDVAEGQLPSWPKVSIIVPARNEERNIREAIQSLLALDYPDYELIVVNDRSNDRTGEILAEIAREHPNLRVENVQELPAGWLGKNHALHSAAQTARGEYILFTDADVFFEPRCLRLAILYATERNVDHLSAAVEAVVPGWLMKSFVLAFGMFFLAYFRPWKASQPNSRTYIGIGAFNLLRTSAYRAVGGHAPLAMRPDDDVMLGKLIKMHGYRQDFVDGLGLLMVPWYGSLREMIRGLEKNFFSGVDYSIPMVVSSSIAALGAFVAPFIMSVIATGTPRWIFVASVLALWFVAIGAAWKARLPIITAFAFPLAVLLFVFVQWRTMLLVLSHGGLQWRDTFYSLSELKANKLVWPKART